MADYCIGVPVGSFPIKKTPLERLQDAESLRDLAAILNYTPAGLAYVLYKTDPATRYRTFQIPKSAGGTRTIHAPNQRLRLLQRRLADLLYDCLSQIESQVPERRRVSHAFYKQRSIITNAAPHCGCRYVLNLDLEGFFDTINFGRVRGFFISDRNFRLNRKVATVIAQIVCHENTLPQGAPSSPVVSNLIGHILDARMIRLARDHGCTYTRYADDLTFSTNRKRFPMALARKRFYFFGKRYVVGHQLRKAIAVAGFKANPAKTRLQFRGSRQMTTGLTVNERVNICQDYYRNVRSMCCSLFQTGSYYVAKSEQGTPTDDLAKLEGRLAHIYYVKNVSVRRKQAELNHRLVPDREPIAPKNLYRRFLFFKYFIANDAPLLVTEGKTDVIYLRTAIKSLHAKFPKLVTITKSKANLAVRFLNASTNNKDILDLGQGYTGMVRFLSSYDKLLKPYNYRPMKCPVIFVVDNDDGGKEVVKAAKTAALKGGGPELDYTSGDLFYHLRNNLYLVLTPPGENGQPSSIEACFPETVLSQKIDGKSFDPKKKDGDVTKFGKHIFAEKIVSPGVATIDFSGFEPILQGISQAITDYQTKHAAPTTVSKSA